MLKRLLSGSIALLGTIVGITLFWFIFMPWLHFPVRHDYWPKLVLALLELSVAIYLFKRWRSWPALLLLVGSIPMLLANISFVGWNWRMERYYSNSPSVDDPWLALLFPSDNEPSPLNTILYYLIWLSMVSLSIAFFVFLFRCLNRRGANRLSTTV